MSRKTILVGACLTLACSTAALVVQSVLAQGANIITTVAGGGPDNVPALSTNIDNPTGIAVDILGNVYVADLAPPRVLKLDTAGLLIGSQWMDPATSSSATG